MSQDQASGAGVPPFVRFAATIGLLAFLLGRALSPALRGTREGLDQIIAYTDRAGSFTSYLFALIGLIVVILELMLTFRDRKLTTAYRLVATVLGACIVSIVPQAFLSPLTEPFRITAGVASGVIAVMAGREAIAIPRTRAIGVLLITAGIAALLHVAASVLAAQAGEHARSQLVTYARILATGSVVFDTLAILTAFAWLATRPQKSTVWAARAALFAACTLAWGVARGGSREGAPLWQLLAYRAVDRLLAHPAGYVWGPFRYVLETSAPLLAVAALTARGQVPAIAGAFALALVARPTTDVPLSALALTLAALSTPLAAHDDRGMWAVLMANSERSHAA